MLPHEVNIIVFRLSWALEYFSSKTDGDGSLRSAHFSKPAATHPDQFTFGQNPWF
jgi:hypothetical protein